MASQDQTLIPTVSTSLSSLLGYYTGQPGATGFSSASTAEQVSAGWKGDGQVAVITGCAAGLGLESLRVLVMRGCEVVAGVRCGAAKMDLALEPIRKQCPAAKITVLPLDTSSLASVRAFAAAFKQRYQGLNILMLNAGCGGVTPFTRSVDGHEMQFATNHLGHFLLTQLLLPELVHASLQPGAPEGRIVAVSSVAHAWRGYKEGIRFDQLDSPTGYDPANGYCQSKLCNVLFARKLARRLQGQRLAVASLHPGVILTTSIWRHTLPSWFQSLAGYATRFFLKDIPQGAATQVYLAVAPVISSGAYYQDVNLAPSSALAKDDVMAGRLWELSEKMCAA